MNYKIKHKITTAQGAYTMPAILLITFLGKLGLRGKSILDVSRMEERMAWWRDVSRNSGHTPDTLIMPRATYDALVKAIKGSRYVK